MINYVWSHAERTAYDLGLKASESVKKENVERKKKGAKAVGLTARQSPFKPKNERTGKPNPLHEMWVMGMKDGKK